LSNEKPEDYMPAAVVLSRERNSERQTAIPCQKCSGQQVGQIVAQ